MGWNVRLFLFLIPYAFWSESSYLSCGVKKLGFLFFYQDHMLLIRRLIGLMDLSLSSVSTTSVCWQLISEPWYCDSKWLCHHFRWMSQIFWAFTAVMLSESSQVSKQSDAFANPFFPFWCPFGQINHTNQWVEVLCCLDIYVGAITMTLGVLGDHLAI